VQALALNAGAFGCLGDVSFKFAHELDHVFTGCPVDGEVDDLTVGEMARMGG
jgi:hypothetical protein